MKQSKNQPKRNQTEELSQLVGDLVQQQIQRFSGPILQNLGASSVLRNRPPGDLFPGSNSLSHGCRETGPGQISAIRTAWRNDCFGPIPETTVLLQKFARSGHCKSEFQRLFWLNSCRCNVTGQYIAVNIDLLDQKYFDTLRYKLIFNTSIIFCMYRSF